jgi:hypothetical protein
MFAIGAVAPIAFPMAEFAKVNETTATKSDLRESGFWDQ